MSDKQDIHISKHFFHRKAIFEYSDSSYNLIRRKEFDIQPDRRFLFHGLELDQLYVSYYPRYEIILDEGFTIKEVNGKFIYVVKSTNEPVPQSQIDRGIISIINKLSLILIPGFLTYQLKKYQRKKEVLKSWKDQFDMDENFIDRLNNWHNKDKQGAALLWVNNRIRKSDRRALKASKDIPLKELFKSKELLNSVLEKLVNERFVEYNHFTGRYVWQKKGQDLAVLGEILNIREYFTGHVDHSIRYNALIKFFSVRDNYGFGERTFRESTIEEVYFHKSGQYSFIRYPSS